MAVDAPKGRVIRRRLVRNAASNYAGKALTLGAGFLLTPFLLHHLGPTNYGLWILAGSVVAYGGLLDFGIYGAVIKFIAEYQATGDEDQTNALIATALWLYTGLGLIAAVMSVALVPLFPRLFTVPASQQAEASWIILLVGLGTALSFPSSIPVAVLRGLHRFDLTNVLSTISVLGYVGTTVVTLRLGGGVIGMAAVNIPRTLLMQVPSLWLVHHAAPSVRFSWRGSSLSRMRDVVSYSASLFAIQAGGQLQTRTDEIVIGTFLPIRAVTPYALALRLSEIPQIVTDQFMKLILPLSSQLRAENDWPRLRLLYKTSTRLALAVLLPLACTTVFLARPILTLWVGPRYGHYAYLVAILAASSVIVTVQWPAGSILQGMARHHFLALTSLASGIVNLALSILLVHRLGLGGVAMGTLVPTAAECFLVVLPYSMRVIGISAGEALREILVPALLPAFPLIVVLYASREVILPSSVLGIAAVAAAACGAYAVSYLALGASDLERETYRGIALTTIHHARSILRSP
jgi:O-antigen/teichoic acid export membrane protein